MTSIEDLLAEIKRRKMFVTNLYEGTDKIWRVFLRKRQSEVYVDQAQGATAAEALRRVLGKTEYEDLF